MGREFKTKKIDGHEYRVQQLDAMQALKLWAKLAGIVGPALARMGSLAGKKSLLEMDLSVLGDAVGELAQRLPPDEFEAIAKQLLTNAERDGKSIDPEKNSNFDVDLAGQMMTVFKVLALSLENNFGDFTAAAQTWMAKAQADAAQRMARIGSNSTASTT